MHANVSHDTTGPQGSTWEGQPSYVPRTTHARLTGGHPEDNKRRNTRHPRNDKTTHDQTIEGAAVRTQPAAQYCMAPHDVSRHALASTEANPQTTRHVPPGGHVALMPRASGSGTQIRIGAVGIAAAMMRGGVYDGNRGSPTSAVPPPEAAGSRRRGGVTRDGLPVNRGSTRGRGEHRGHGSTAATRRGGVYDGGRGSSTSAVPPPEAIGAVAPLGLGCPSTGAAPAGGAIIAATAAASNISSSSLLESPRSMAAPRGVP